MKRFLHLAMIAALLLLSSPHARASQGSACMPTSGTVSGLTLVQDLNAAFAAVISMNSGATAPLTDCSGLSILGQPWLDTTTNTVKVYDGANWLSLGKIDASSHVWTPRIGGGSDSLTAGTTTDLGSVAAGLVTINGGTAITSFGSSAETGIIKLLRFTGTPTLTYSSNLLLPTGANIVVAAGDQASAVYLGGGVWSVWAYTRADGTSVSTSSVFIGAVGLQSPISATLASNTNNWNPSGLSNANVIRLTCSPAITVTGLVAPLFDGKLVVLNNVGAANCTLTAQDASSTAGNRFVLANSSVIVQPGASIFLLYDFTAARWRQVGLTGDVQGPSSSTADNIASFTDTTGKLVKDSGAAIADVHRRVATGTLSSGVFDLPTVFSSNASCRYFDVIFENIIPVTGGGVGVVIQVYTGGVLQTSNYSTYLIGTGGAGFVPTAYIPLTRTIVPNTGTNGASGYVRVYNPLGGGIVTYSGLSGAGVNSTNFDTAQFAGAFYSAAVNQGFRLSMSSGNIASGVLSVYCFR